LNNTVNNYVLDSTVFTLGVFSNQERVNIVVRSLVSLDRFAWSDVGEKIEGSAKSKIEGDMTLADGSSQRAFEGDVVLADALDRLVWNHGTTIYKSRSYVNRFPFDRGLDIVSMYLTMSGSHVSNLRCSKYVLDRLGDLGANSIAFN
jgi:hypothetical protein